MEPIEFLDPWYYGTAFYILFLFLCWATVLYYIGSAQQKILHAEGSPIQAAALFLTVFLIYMLGLRQITGDFGDTRAYYNGYRLMDPIYSAINFKTEWFWHNFAVFCRQIHLNPHEYLLAVEFVYIGGMFWCAWMLMRKNLWIAMLYFFTAFSFFSYGTNGIRNGMACSIEIVALCLLTDGSSAKRYFSFFLMFLALGTHRSTMLPSAAAIASLYFIKDTKNALRFWLVSIAISLVAGPMVTSFFASLGFDDRMSSYSVDAAESASADYFSNTGFRWDFLLYSSFPVALIWYITRFRRFTDQAYTVFANVYLLCNAFWIMVIRSSFSNRFAYLSWFIYPVVMTLPLLRMNLWKDQDRKTAIMLFLYSGFSFFMFFIYYFGTTGFRGFDLYWWRE